MHLLHFDHNYRPTEPYTKSAKEVDYTGNEIACGNTLSSMVLFVKTRASLILLSSIQDGLDVSFMQQRINSTYLPLFLVFRIPRVELSLGQREPTTTCFDRRKQCSFFRGLIVDVHVVWFFDYFLCAPSVASSRIDGEVVDEKEKCKMEAKDKKKKCGDEKLLQKGIVIECTVWQSTSLIQLQLLELLLRVVVALAGSSQQQQQYAKSTVQYSSCMFSEK